MHHYDPNSEDARLEMEYEDYLEEQYQAYLDRQCEDYVYNNIIIPQYFEDLDASLAEPH